MEFFLSTSSGTPIYKQIITQVQHMVASGRIRPGDELPSVRVLAHQLTVNPNTIARAYKDLETMGLLVSRQGAGTFVSDAGSPLARREKRRIILEQIDALLAQAHQLGISNDELQDLLAKRAIATSSDEQSA